ncbi:MAG: LytTR family transcriptional regulator DNA-binding domain-containing protein [Acetatifactor sp.]|nr:LytTR family transcriptional regulator DNA-binding domain-containing protein [Acetatifactor sp.]
MKVTIEKILTGQDELIIRCKEETPLIRQIMTLLDESTGKIYVLKEKEKHLLPPSQILYLESVDETTYVYTRDDIYVYPASLSSFEGLETPEVFFRCSKSMIINIRYVERLKSLPYNKIDAELTGGEHVIINRHYAATFRELLRGGKS